MKNVLWIPCYNEGTRPTTYKQRDGQIFEGPRHTAYETLRLLCNKIRSGVFSIVMISNDGSTDDTLEGIQRFQREEDTRSSVFRIIGSQTNEGKMARFFEAFQMCADAETFTITDADMIDPGEGDTFEVLGRPLAFGRRKMLVSRQGEYCPARKTYDISDSSTSGTRSLRVGPVTKSFSRFQISANNLPGRGYGLEMLLNRLFLYPKGSAHINHVGDDTIPLFLPPFRRRTGGTQSTDIDYTFRKLEEHLSSHGITDQILSEEAI